uniref:HNH endonuclease 5 domain-containing protein n=1 Tax=Caulobacter sp. (strain K31) TaxID=366602 RepID=B0T9H9_CAUSK
MSKQFKGKTCVYCLGEGISSTGDHVFARQFFPVDRRANLPKVAACAPCNGAKSQIEHYLTAVLPFGGRHADSSQMLTSEVPARLARNRKLHQSLIAGRTRVVAQEHGEVIDNLGVPFDADKLSALFAYIARGLTAFHWDILIPPSHRVEALMLNPEFEPFVRGLFLSRAHQRVAGDVGDGAFRYQGAQAIGDPAMTIWRFQVYGGLVVAGDPHVPGPGAHTPWVLTTPLTYPGLLDPDP